MRHPLVLALVLLSACAPVLDETRRTEVLTSGYNRGERYEIVTRTLEGRNGPYEQTRVQYHGRSEPCIATSPGDCEKAARRVIDQRFRI